MRIIAKRHAVAGLVFIGLSGAALQEASAQATNLVCTRCVQTSDIATGAVTNSRLGTNAVTNARIANGAVTAAKMPAGSVNNAKVANNAVNTSKLTTAAVTEAKLANNAVNGAKIANASVITAKLADGAVNSVKLADGAVSAAKLGDGAVAAAKLGLINTTYIEDSGDAVANCTALLDALSGLTGPAALVLGPGTFDCGANRVVLTNGISLIGAGRGLTKIVGAVGGDEGVVQLMESETEVRNLAVTNDGAGQSLGGLTGIGVKTFDGTGPIQNWTISEVSAMGLNGTDQTIGIRVSGDDCDGGQIRDSSAMGMTDGGADGTNVFCSAGTVIVSNLDSNGAGSVSGSGFKGRGDVKVLNSAFSGTSRPLDYFENFGFDPLTGRVVSTELDGTVDADNSSVFCINSFDGAGAPLADGAFGAGGCV